MNTTKKPYITRQQKEVDARRARRKEKMKVRSDARRELHMLLGMVKLPPLTESQKTAFTEKQLRAYETVQALYKKHHTKGRAK